MTFCAQATLGFTNATRRNAVLADVESWIAGRPQWGDSTVESATTRAGAPAVLLTIRFTTRVDQEDLLARVQAFATGVRTPVAGSWFRLHDCPHDESDLPCAVASEVTW